MKIEFDTPWQLMEFFSSLGVKVVPIVENRPNTFAILNNLVSTGVKKKT